MKKRIVKILCVALVLVMFAGLFSACSKHGKTMLTCGKNEISVNVYQLYLSRMKGSLSLTGENVSSTSYWETIVKSDGTTLADYYDEQVYEGLKQIAAALYLYDEMGLSLDKDLEKEIDEWIETLIDELANGSKSELNALLAPYGANVTVLRDAAIIEEKLAQLKTELYGEDGSKIADTAKEEFYDEMYYRGYQMLISYTYLEHDRENGRSVYYVKDSDYSKIAYDTENGVLSEGETDKFGDPVYRVADGYAKGEIAYDKVNGVRNFTMKDGEYVTAYYTEQENAERLETLEAIAKECQNNPDLFLEYVSEWSDNPDFHTKSAPNGMYFSAGTYTHDEVLGPFATQLATLAVGELAIVESASGYHLIMRFALDDMAWKQSENAYWFSTFNTLCVEYMLQNKTQKYLQFVKEDEDVKASVSIVDVSANTTF